MAKYNLLIFTNAKPGQDAEFNLWYDEKHLPELVTLDAVAGGKRYDVFPGLGGQPAKFKYLAVYELEGDDPQAAASQILEAAQTGKLSPSDTVDRAETFSVVVTRR